MVAKHGAITNGVTEAGCAAFPVRSRDGRQRGDGARRIYLDLIKASGLDVAIRKHVRVAGEQGWLDLQMIVALIVLNLAGGGGLEDLERLEQDAGFVQVMREVERRLLLRADRCRRAGASLGGAPCHRPRRCGWPGSTTPRPASRARPAARSSRRWLSRFAPCGRSTRRCSGSSRRTGGWRWRPWTWTPR